jgi:hypothetical protein
MANGKTAQETIGAVKSHIDSLEVSPSHRSATSPIAHGGTRAVGHGATGHTGKFAAKGKTTRPNPRGTKTGFGKKDHSYQKTHGR